MENFTINEVNYIYDYEQMTAVQILLCQAAWEQAEAIKKVLPTSTDELFTVIQKRANEMGYEYLLMVIDNDKKLLRSNKNKNISCGVLDNMLGADFKRLEACKNDFFTKQGIISENLINITKQLLGSGELMKLIQGSANDATN